MDKYSKRQTLENSDFSDTFLGKVNSHGSLKTRPTFRFYRYCTMILVHLLFVLSFVADIQILEGDISGSRFLGFHLCDPFMNLEVISARGEIAINLMIGTITILLFYAFFAGRAFCSWVCPYNFFAEFAEALNAKLIARKIIKRREFTQNSRYTFLLSFLLLTLLSGHLLFEIFNVVGIVSRFIIYGYSAAIWWVVLALLAEAFFSRRFWCRNICPLGTIYALLARFRAIKIAWNKDKCDHCGVCLNVCICPKVLEITKSKAKDLPQGGDFSVISGDCTLCGRCIDVCHEDALKFENRLKKLL